MQNLNHRKCLRPLRSIYSLFAILLGAAVLMGGSSADSQERNTVIRLGARTFEIPREYSAYTTTMQNSVGDRAGAAFDALLPNLEPFNSESRKTDRVHISVEYPMRRSASDDLQGWIVGNKKMYVGTGTNETQPDGVSILRSDRKGSISKTRFWDIYAFPNKEYAGTSSEIIFCNQINESGMVSRCRDAFLYSDLLIKVTFDFQRLSQWREIRAGVISKLDRMTSQKTPH